MKRHDTTDFGALAIKAIGVVPTRGGFKTEDSTPVGIQSQTGRRVEFRLVGQQQGHARHACLTDNSLIAALFNRGMLGDVKEIGKTRLSAAEDLQEIYEKTGNRQQVCGSYTPTRAQGEPEATPEEMSASIKYHAAIDSMSQWQWRIVRKVVIEDQMVDGLDLQHLVAGLDNLIRHMGK